MTSYTRTMREAREEMLQTESMSSAQIAKLKKVYEPMRDKKISTANANKLSAMMDKFGKDKDVLIQLFKADIPFVSQSAVTKLITKYNMKGAELNKLRERFGVESVELDEGTKQVLAHGGKGKYKVVNDGSGSIDVMFKGKSVGKGDYDRGAGSFFMSIKGEKGQKSFDDAQAIADYFAKNKITEEVELDEAKYDLYHKDFSSAMQHAYKMAKKLHGITVDPKEIDDKVASGPRKPSEGKTNKYRLKGDKGAIQVQVYNKGGSKPFELNMYKEEVELDEAISASSAYALVIQQKDGSREIVAKGSKEKMKSAAKKYGGLKQGKVFISLTGKKVGDKILGIGEEVSLMSAVEEQLAKIKGNTPGDQGRRGAVEDDIERAEKKGDKKLVKKLKEDDLDEAVKEYDVKIKVGSKTNSYNIMAKDELSAAQSVIHSVMARSRTGGSPGLDAVRKQFPDMKSLKKKGISVSIKEEVDLDEGRGRPRKDGTTGGSEDRENIQMQLRKSVSLRGLKDVEFADGNKVKVSARDARDVLGKLDAIKAPRERQNAVVHIAKSHKNLVDFAKGKAGEMDPEQRRKDAVNSPFKKK